MIVIEPIEVDAVLTVFGATGKELKALLPSYESIPGDFKSPGNVWVKWQRQWETSSLGGSFPKTKEGFCAKAVRVHLSAIQRSFEPSNKHRRAAVAYLASLWYHEPLMTDNDIMGEN
jgi:hypothetical protein